VYDAPLVPFGSSHLNAAAYDHRNFGCNLVEVLSLLIAGIVAVNADFETWRPNNAWCEIADKPPIDHLR
jgi:hypothetical protein